MKKLIALSCILLSTQVLAQAHNNRGGQGQGGANRSSSQPQQPGRNNHRSQPRRVIEKELKVVTIDNKPQAEIIKVDSCSGLRNEKLKSLTFKFMKNDVDLKSVKVSYESRIGGIPTGMKKLKIKSKVYKEGELVKVNITTNKCIDSISIDAKPEERMAGPGNQGRNNGRNGRNNRPGQPAPSMTAKIKVSASIEK